MIEKKIYINNFDEEFSVQEIFYKLQNKAGDTVRFCKTDEADLSNYYIQIIGETVLNPDNLDNIHNTQNEQIKIIIVNSSVFERYEKWKKDGGKSSGKNAIFELIGIYNTGAHRNWIYSYNTVRQAYDLIMQIIFSDIFCFSAKDKFLMGGSKQVFSNTFMLKNNGCSTLTDFYIEISGQLVSAANKEKIYTYTSIAPGNADKINISFQTPEEAGIYAFYVTLKNKNRSLKRKDAVLDFKIQVENHTKQCSVVIKDEFPAQGEISFDKHVFEKRWIIKNNTNENWKYVILKPKNSMLLQLYSLEWEERKFYSIKAGALFEISAKMYTPDIPGSYVQYWELFRPDGSRISTNTPLRCYIQTQYDAIPEFEVMDHSKVRQGILDRLEMFLGNSC